MESSLTIGSWLTTAITTCPGRASIALLTTKISPLKNPSALHAVPFHLHEVSAGIADIEHLI